MRQYYWRKEVFYASSQSAQRKNLYYIITRSSHFGKGTVVRVPIYWHRDHYCRSGLSCPSGFLVIPAFPVLPAFLLLWLSGRYSFPQAVTSDKINFKKRGTAPKSSSRFFKKSPSYFCCRASGIGNI
jgi:hypothetical protein